MKILMQSRITLFSSPGGDTTQIIKTAEYIRKLGHHVDITVESTPDVSAYDVVHIFNLRNPQDIYLQVLNAKKQGKKVALSTIWGEYTEYDKFARGGIYGLLANIFSGPVLEYGKILARAILNREYGRGTMRLLLLGYRSLQLRLCQLVDVYLPNSESEMKRVKLDMKLKDPKYVVIPNAVDLNSFNYFSKNIDESKFEWARGALLCAARIEGRKSQLQLIRAVKDLPYKLIIVGKPGPNAKKYFLKCKKEAGANVVFLDYINHDDLPALYKVCKAHALISWMETPGLSSLEAAAMGCNLLITEKGDTVDYFGNYAVYCDPASVVSIKKGVEQVMSQDFNMELLERISSNFTWELAAQKTIEAYKLAWRTQ